jgi:hypothetical protein
VAAKPTNLEQALEQLQGSLKLLNQKGRRNQHQQRAAGHTQKAIEAAGCRGLVPRSPYRPPDID